MSTDITLNNVALSSAVPAAKVLRPVRPLLGAQRTRHVAVPGKAGAWRYTDEPGDRVITVLVDVQADTFAARSAALEDLADWADVGTPANIIVDDQTDRYHVGILDDAPDVDDWLNNGTVTLRFRCDPYALAVSTSSESATASGSPDTDTFVAADDIAAEPIVELTPLNGTLTGFTWTLNGDALVYGTGNTTIASGNTVTLSSISDTVTLGVNGDTMLTGAYTGTIAMQDVSGVFGLITPGTNTWALTWTGTATNVGVSITWRRRYRR